MRLCVQREGSYKGRGTGELVHVCMLTVHRQVLLEQLIDVTPHLLLATTHAEEDNPCGV
jgi:hypothetical protein